MPVATPPPPPPVSLMSIPPPIINPGIFYLFIFKKIKA
jgi:hypothetical protein